MRISNPANNNEIYLKRENNFIHSESNNILLYYRDIYPLANESSLKNTLKESIKIYKQDLNKFIKFFSPSSSLILHDKPRNFWLLKPDASGYSTFYYYDQNKTFIFDNNLRKLANTVGLFKLNKLSFAEFLETGNIAGNSTILEHIKKIPPSYFLVNDGNTSRNIRIPSFYSKPKKTNEKYFLEILKSSFMEFFLKFKGIPVGAMISGGLDSTFILEMIQNINNKVSSYCIGNKSYWPANFKRCETMSEYLNLPHSNVEISIADYIESFRVFEKINEPIFDLDLPAIHYFLNKFNPPEKFIFHGYGSDEVFGGKIDLLIKKNKINKKQLNSKKDYIKAISLAICSVLNNTIPQSLNAHQTIASLNGKHLIFPFLDKHILEIASTLPFNLKINGSLDKYIFRSLCKSIIPAEIYSFKKEPSVSIPGAWKNIVLKRYEDYITNSILIKEYAKNNCFRIKNSTLKFKLLIMELWFRNLPLT